MAIVFTNDNDLSLWRQSPRRNTWLESGVERGLALNDNSMLIDAEKITLQKDDGSLGGTPSPSPSPSLSPNHNPSPNPNSSPEQAGCPRAAKRAAKMAGAI